MGDGDRGVGGGGGEDEGSVRDGGGWMRGGAFIVCRMWDLVVMAVGLIWIAGICILF